MKYTKFIIATAILSVFFSSPTRAQSHANPLSMTYSGDQSILNDFNVEQPSFYRYGSHIFFTVHGQPGSHGVVTIQTPRGVKATNLYETDRGLYEGFYTVKSGDDFENPSYSARLEKHGRVGEASTFVELYEPSHQTEYHSQPLVCNHCGVIASIREVDDNSNDANVPGLLIGGLVGGVAGHQIGNGSGRDAATIIGALVGGAVGNQVGRDQNRHRVWLITVNLDNGTSQTFKNDQPPSASPGQRVRIQNNQLVLEH